MAEITNEIIEKTADKEIVEGSETTITDNQNKGEEIVRVEENKVADINELEEYIKPEQIPKEPKSKGNPNWIKGFSANPKGRPKNKPFSIREDLIKSLKRIKKRNPEKYQDIIDSYWADNKMRQFLLEIVDGKARQSIEMAGTMENPVRVIEVKPMEEPKTADNINEQIT